MPCLNKDYVSIKGPVIMCCMGGGGGGGGENFFWGFSPFLGCLSFLNTFFFLVGSISGKLTQN